MDGDYQKTIVFDIDETTLTNLPVYKETDFYPDSDEREAYYDTGKLAAIPATLRFYKANKAKA